MGSVTSPTGVDVVILGSGVIGLSIAAELVNRGLKPAIVARDLPEDSNSTGFASPWAGCNWHPFDKDGNSQGARCDRITFGKLDKLSKDYPDLCERVDFVDLYSEKKPVGDVWYKELVGGMEEVNATSSAPLNGGLPYAHKWRSFIMDAPNYIQHLASQLKSHGVPLIRKRLSSLDEAYDLPEVGPVELVVNATGLGSRVLLGVEDDQVFPAKGQTVLVKAPKVRRCVMRTEDIHVGKEPPIKSTDPKHGKPGLAYIIPRPGPKGHVILGGTYLENDYTTDPDPKVALRILQNCYSLETLLAGEDGKSWEDIEVVSHNAGLRPVRRGGARIETEERVLGQLSIGPKISEGLRGKKVGVVHAYGFGPAGFQASLGAAEMAADLVGKWLKQHPTQS